MPKVNKPNPKVYVKGIVAAAGAALVVLNESGLFIDQPWFSSVVAVATVFGVIRARNAPA